MIAQLAPAVKQKHIKPTTVLVGKGCIPSFPIKAKPRKTLVSHKIPPFLVSTFLKHNKTKRVFTINSVLRIEVEPDEFDELDNGSIDERQFLSHVSVVYGKLNILKAKLPVTIKVKQWLSKDIILSATYVGNIYLNDKQHWKVSSLS